VHLRDEAAAEEREVNRLQSLTRTGFMVGLLAHSTEADGNNCRPCRHAEPRFLGRLTAAAPTDLSGPAMRI